ncbi:hypothetical protein [Novosphingobium sp. BL-52-GroH]|uniref:hypothetical protein n=1 Tax=Novosphingobium sp. BL-52-GroH TaxID=3349877 RepID=UPI00384ACF26
MMTTMKKLTLGLSAAALAIGGVACAQAPATPPHDRPGHDRPRIDANGDGTVTRAEAQAAATAMFARLDVDKDGKLDQADRDLGRQQMRDRMFARLDANGDGSISKAEFSAEKGPDARGPGMDGPPPPGGPGEDAPPPPPPGQDGPDKAGHGPDGRGDHDRHGGRGGHGFGRGGHGGMMAMARDADANKDGAISQAEFMAAAMKRFDAEDTNHDGQVTKAEREAAHAAKKARWDARKADKKADKKPSN